MIWYFKDKSTYLYPSNEPYEDSFTKLTYDKHYNYSAADSIVPSLEYMETHRIKQACCVVPIENLSVNYGNSEDINKEYCDINNIPYFYIDRVGGTIVLFQGNVVGDAIYAIESADIVSDFIKEFTAYLTGFGLSSNFDGNDILVDNKKIVGLVYKPIIKNYYYFGVSISINADINLIKNICTKPMKKIPGALSDYGITTDEVMEFVLDWFHRHMNDI